MIGEDNREAKGEQQKASSIVGGQIGQKQRLGVTDLGAKDRGSTTKYQYQVKDEIDAEMRTAW